MVSRTLHRRSPGTPEPGDRWYTSAALREMDRLAETEFGISTLVLMENAGSELARVCLGEARRRGCARVLVVCGPGNNGGDGLVAARHLDATGIGVRVVMLRPIEATTACARVNAEILRACGVGVRITPAPGPARLGGGRTLIVDAIFGTGLSRPPERGPAAWIRWINRHRERGAAVVVSADIPSGLDGDSGLALGDAVRADVTVSFAGNKAGFRNRASRAYTGRVRVAPIGVPRVLLERLALDHRARAAGAW